MNKKQTMICALAALLLSAGSLRAQDNGNSPAYRGELGVSIYMPTLASMPFEGSLEWKDKLGVSYGIGADYTYWFNQFLGLSGGLRYTLIEHNQEVAVPQMKFNGTHTITAFGLTDVTMLAKDININEEHTVNMLEIPLMINLKKNNAYLNLGVSLAFALSHNANYGYKVASFSITDVPAMGITLPAPVPVTLDGNIEEVHSEPTSLDKIFLCELGAEVGYLFRYNDRNAVSVGLFGRYGLNKLESTSTDNPYILANGHIAALQPSTTNMIDNMGYYEVGLRITYHYGLGKKK